MLAAPLSLLVLVVGILLFFLLQNITLRVSGLAGKGETELNFQFNASLVKELLELRQRTDALEQLVNEDTHQLLDSLIGKRNILDQLLTAHGERHQQAGLRFIEKLMEDVFSEQTWQRLKTYYKEIQITNETAALEREVARARVDADAKMKFEAENFEKIQQAKRLDLELRLQIEGDNTVKAIHAAGAAVSDSGAWLLVLFFTLRLVYQILRDKPPPPLIEESSLSSNKFWRRICRCGGSIAFLCLYKKRRHEQELPNSLAEERPRIILESNTMQTVVDFLQVLSLARRNGDALPTACFYGPPGTGKTITAKRIARTCGLDYAIMSGGSVISLQSGAVPELRKVFAWARQSATGLLLFIDEAEAFLQQREACADPFVRAAISYFLSQTGEASKYFSIILATNHISALDSAVMSRMVHALEFQSPSAVHLEQLCQDRDFELLQMLQQFTHPSSISNPDEGADVNSDAATSGSHQSVSGNTVFSLMAKAKFSGRDIQQLHEEFKRQRRLKEERKRLADSGVDLTSSVINDPDSTWLSRFLAHKIDPMSETSAGA